MVTRILLVLAAAAFVQCALPALAQKEKRPDISGFRFITGPKGEQPHVPGLNAILLLTDEQKEQLVLARRDTIQSEAVLLAARKVKGDPNAADADRQAARDLLEQARGQYDRRVGQILTAAQKELVQRLHVLYGQAREAAAEAFASRLAGAKGNEAETDRLRREARDAQAADFTRRVNEILTPEQRAAFERAAAEERRREAASKK